MSKSIKTYDEFVQQDIAPRFQLMAIVDTAGFLGVEPNDIINLKKRKINTHDYEMLKIIDKFEKELNKKIIDETFLNNILTRLRFIIDYGGFSIEENSFRGSFFSINKKRKLDFELLIEENTIYFKSERENGIKILTGVLKKDNKKEYSIMYKEHNIKTFLNSNSQPSYNEKTNIKVEFYDKKGIQQCGFTSEVKKDYIINDSTNSIILNKPNPNENYTELVYSWRHNDSIIQKIIKNYIYPEQTHIHNMDCMVIGKNENPKQKKLTEEGIFDEIPVEMYEKFNCMNELENQVGKFLTKK